MLDDSIGRGERQARALVAFVIVIEAIWIFLHKYLPLDATLWSLQADAIRLHIGGGTNDGLRLVPLPAANVLIPLVSGILSFFFNGEIVVRLLIVLIGFVGRGFAMLSMLRALKVREALVFFLVPVFVWSGVFFIGNLPYLAGETLAIALVSFFLKQDRPRSGAYYVLLIGFAAVALCHALAFFAVVLITFAIANEQRRSVHLSQGWLSNFNRVVGLVIPGSVVLLLRFLSPAPVFMLSTSGFIPDSPTNHFLFTLAATPHIQEAGFPGSDIIAAVISTVVVVLALASLVRAFLLPMEEVTWQSRSAKRAGIILLVFSLLGFLLYHIGLETSAFIWMAMFFIMASSYSRGPAVRRGLADRFLRSLAFIAMIAAGILNGLSTNRGSEAASDLREQAVSMLQSERESAKENQHLDSLDFKFVIDSGFIANRQTGIFPSISYSATSIAYLYGKGTKLNAPSEYQPRGGMLESETGKPLPSPADKLSLGRPDQYFEPHLRILAVAPIGLTNSVNFGPYARGMRDTSIFIFDRAEAKFQVMLGRLSSEQGSGFAEVNN
jgi:hypothetical protein